MNPLISICIPTYNGAAYIAEALESALQQTYCNLEIIVSDDASNDDTLKIIESYKSKTNIPIYIFHHEPKGIGANWNNCVKHARGKYIKFLFQDDILHPYCLEKMVALAERDENIGLVYCKRDFIFDTSESDYRIWLKKCGVLHKSWHSLKVETGILSGTAYLGDKYLLDLPNNKIGEPTAVLLRRACFDRVSYFDERLSQTLDFEYWYRLMPFFNVAFLDETLITFRLHGAQATQQNEHKKTRDRALLPWQLMKNVFWKLHPKQRWYVLKEVFGLNRLKALVKKIRRKLRL